MATTTVTATYLTPQGLPCRGRVTFRLTAAAYQDTADAIVPTVKVTAVLDDDGQITVELEPTSGDDAALDGEFTYEVTERISGANRDPYWVDVPTAATVDLGTLTTYETEPGIVRQLVTPDLTDLGYITEDALIPYSTTEVADATYTHPIRFIEDVAEPWILYHRGLSMLAPENTAEAFEAALSCGAQVIETDFWLTQDGSLICVHDETLDRTTASTGDVADLNAGAAAALRDDYGATLGGAWTTRELDVPTFQSVINQFGGRVVLVCEAKNSGSAAAMVAYLDLHPQLQNTVIISSFLLGELAVASAAGYETALYLGNTSTPAATVAGYGHTYIGLADAGVTEAYIAALAAEDLKVWARPDANSESHYLRGLYLAAGAAGLICDDGLYMTPGNPHRRTTDSWGLATWGHGHRPMETIGRRGVFIDGGWGYQTGLLVSSCLIGELCPIADPENFTLTFTYHQDELDSTVTRWGSLFLSTNDVGFHPSAAANPLNEGYHMLIRQNGSLEIFRYDDGVATSALDTAALATLGAGTSHDFTLTVTPTDITLERDGVGEVSIIDATYRGGYLHLVQWAISGHKCHWSDLEIT